jgi:translation elongation factor EF-Ts
LSEGSAGDKGDIEGAFVVLRKRGMASAQKKAARSTNEGAVGTTFTPAARSA